MVDNFYRDLEFGKEAEVIVRDRLSSLDDSRTYELVGDNPLYYHRGDIRVVDKESGEVRFIEVKNDSVIHKTGNILCEEEVYFKKQYYSKDGNMFSDYDIYAVVCKEQRKIYIINFEVLKKNYRKGSFKVIEHSQQITYAYLLHIDEIKRLGGLISVVSY